MSKEKFFKSVIGCDRIRGWNATKDLSVSWYGEQWEYYSGALKNSYITFIFIELIQTWAIKNSCSWLILKKTFQQHRLNTGCKQTCPVLFFLSVIRLVKHAYDFKQA